jgi:hypothetical protein
MEIEELKVDECALSDAKVLAMAEELKNMKIKSLQHLRLFGEDEATQPTLVIKILSAHLHCAADETFDPYCVCRVNEREVFRTPVLIATSDPVWKCENRAVLLEPQTDTLEFWVMNGSSHKKDDQIVGSCKFFSTDFSQGFEGPRTLHRSQKTHQQNMRGVTGVDRPSGDGTGQSMGTVNMSKTNDAFRTMKSMKSRTEKESKEKMTLELSITWLPQITVTAHGIGDLLESLRGSQIEELGSVFCDLDDDKARAVATALPGLRAMRRYDFSNSWHVSSEGWRQVLLAMRDQRVQELSFRKCRLDDSKVSGIAEGLSHLRGIQHIDFSWNRQVSERGWKDILKSLRRSSLASLNLDHCLLNDSKIHTMKNYFPKYLKEDGLSLVGNAQISEMAQRELTFALANPRPVHSSMAGSMIAESIPLLQLEDHQDLHSDGGSHNALLDTTLRLSASEDEHRSSMTMSTHFTSEGWYK